MIKKTCTKCQAEKEITEFHKSKDGKFGVRAICKVCIRQMDRDYYAKHREEILPKKNEYQKEYYLNNSEKVNKYQKERYLKTRVLKGRPKAVKKEKVLKVQKTPKSRAELWKSWYERNKQDLMDKANEKRRTNDVFRIEGNIRRRINHALNGKYKKEQSLKYLGISGDDYKQYLECLFDETMNWENYGKHWVIDHIIPVSFFDLSCEDSKFKAFNFRNTRPLSRTENARKSNVSISALYDIIGADLMIKNLSIER